LPQLETLYETHPKAVGFIARRYDVPHYTCNIFGPPRSGKTWLVLDYLATLPKKRRLYIDGNDPRIDWPSLERELPSFIRAHRIETVVLDHYHGQIELPRCRQCIIVTQAPLEHAALMPRLEVAPLDFEEYLAFERRHAGPEHSFSLYLRTGALPAMAMTHESLLTPRLHALVRELFPDENERALFRRLARRLGKPASAHQLYTELKKERRISKDWAYRTIKSWEARQIVRWLPKMAQPRAPKRVLLFDFALPVSLHFEKSLMGQLLSLASQHLLRRIPETTWSDTIDLFDPINRHAYLISPFGNQPGVATKIGTMTEIIDRLGIRRITILTIANAFAFHFDHVPVTAKPFYEWILE
jgi:predicted AAA+ superfamily ATPase